MAESASGLVSVAAKQPAGKIKRILRSDWLPSGLDGLILPIARDFRVGSARRKSSLQLAI